MQLRYFPDTDTLNVAFGEVGPVAETVDGPTKDILLYFDKEHRLVGMLLEHASKTTSFEDLKASPHFETVGEPAHI